MKEFLVEYFHTVEEARQTASKRAEAYAADGQKPFIVEDADSKTLVLDLEEGGTTARTYYGRPSHVYTVINGVVWCVTHDGGCQPEYAGGH